MSGFTAVRAAQSQGTATLDDSDRLWAETCHDFLASVPGELHECVKRSLHSLHGDGCGLRAWVSSIARQQCKLPECVPAALIRIYLDDPEASPLHDCETCGIAIPVRPNRFSGPEGEPEQTYFSACPVCGGRTGQYLYVSRQIEGDGLADALRRSKPR